VLKYFAHTGYLLLHNLQLPLYIAYIIGLSDTLHKVKKNRLLSCALILPLIFVVGLILTNPFTGKIFYLDETDRYTRGSWFILLYVVVSFYTVIVISYLVHYKKLFSSKQYISLLTTYPILIAAVIFQLFYPAYPVEMFATAMALLFISVMIKPPEESIDNITGLNNFASYASDMKRNFTNEKPVKIIMINISNFSSLKAMLGYDRSINVLKKIARDLITIDNLLMLKAELYYLDNGRFRIVVGERYFDRVDEAALKINTTLKHTLKSDGMDINLVPYICIARCPEDITDFEMLIAYGLDFQNRQYTGDVFYAADTIKKERYDILLNIDSIIDEAFANRNFSVYYQPIYSINEQRFTSAEALLRLKNDKYGFISPELFIPAAENNGTIHKIGEFVFDEVCKFIASADFERLGLQYIEVNLSVVQCMQKGLADDLINTLKKYNISPDKINLEITETAAAYSQQIMDDNIKALTDAGIKLSLDDFGTGYSNMKRIASLPLHIVKLDKTFTDIEDNQNLTIVLKNTIRMIKDMNMKIVVEGVETEDLVKKFSDYKCDYIQGYYFSKPVPKKDFIAFVESRNL
jgi:EAL domain-containing protein (putative c-di-GMP-specific phosphodiesterase class I)/GGDEF domain-containing protein